MPRGIPKPPNACRLTGCYELAAASVEIYHDHVGGYRSTTFQCCHQHAAEFDLATNEPSNGAYVTWHRVPTDTTKRTP